MNIQEAYVKGLNDAENNVIQNLVQLLTTEESQPFPNPELEKIRKVIENRSNYYRELAKRNNNYGKRFRKTIQEEHQILGVNIPPPEAEAAKELNAQRSRNRRRKKVDKSNEDV